MPPRVTRSALIKALGRAELTMRWAEQQTLVPGMEAADAMRATLVQHADQIRRLLERVKRKKKAPARQANQSPALSAGDAP
jgi:hypothetical protein